VGRVFAAVDVGASGGRVMAGLVDDGKVRLREVHRFPNGVVAKGGHLRWDLRRLYAEILDGLSQIPEAEAIGVDTWGVDYGLLDEAGHLLADPIAYRDDRGSKAVDAVHSRVSREELYALTGIQFLAFNTIYQLVAEQESPLWSRAAGALLIPDLLAYWLTGQRGTEVTNASTTGLLDVKHRCWSTDLLDRLGIPADLLAPLEDPGTQRGRTPGGTPVITVGSHDTASAVVGIPAVVDNFAYIASGTWSLVGLELDGPVLSQEARSANFTNEVGLDGTTRFLRNTGGLWLLAECLQAWGREDVDNLMSAAGALPAGPHIDVDDPALLVPGGTPDKIAQRAGAHLQPAEIVRCILDSLAGAYAKTVWEAAHLAGRDVEVIHLVGGGARNPLLCQLTAEAAGLPVIAGPVEATALGNVVVQARSFGVLPDSLPAIRSALAVSTPLRRYQPD